MQNPNEDTEWNDILRKVGILPNRPTVETAGQSSWNPVISDRDPDANSDEEADLDEDQAFAEYRYQALKPVFLPFFELKS